MPVPITNRLLTRRFLCLSVVLALIQLSGSSSAVVRDSADIAPFGKVFLYSPQSAPQNVIIMISGDAGWKFGVLGFAEKFAEMNNIVVGVDVLRYLKELRQRTEECYHVASDFVELVTTVEKKYNFREYRPAVVMGYSSGATLVYGILAQSRPGTFIGGISLGFCPDIELPKLLCETNGLTEKVDITGKSYFLEPDAKLGNPWIVLHGKVDKVCSFADVVDFVGKTTDAELVALPGVGHGFSKWGDFMPQWKDAFTRLVTKYDNIETQMSPAEKVKDLPLVITKSKSADPEAPVALIISGDGGWYSFEQSIADNLADKGIPTVGLDSKKYFWKRKTPDETTRDIETALNYYSKLWGRSKFLLIGYSLGAEIIPFVVNRLPETMKAVISSSVMLSPGTSTDFEIHISNMLGMGNRQNTYNVAKEITRMDKIPALIILGSGEKTEVPEILAGTDVNIVKIPGDHHYKFNVPLIIKTMKDYKSF